VRIDAIMDIAGVIPVLEVERLDDAAPLAQALAAGGLRVIELTLRTACALEAVGAMKRAAPSLIVGMGPIGQNIARLLAMLGMRSIGVRRTAEPVEPCERVVAYEQLHQVLPGADWLILCCPASPVTRGIANAAAFAAMWRAIPMLRPFGLAARHPLVLGALEAAYLRFLRLRPRLQRLLS